GLVAENVSDLLEGGSGGDKLGRCAVPQPMCPRVRLRQTGTPIAEPHGASNNGWRDRIAMEHAEPHEQVPMRGSRSYLQVPDKRATEASGHRQAARPVRLRRVDRERGGAPVDVVQSQPGDLACA